MKKYIIEIECDIICMEYCSQKVMDEAEDDGFDKFFSYFFATYGMDNIVALTVNNGENLVKKKGKYIKTKEFFHDLWSDESDHPLPVEVHTKTFSSYNPQYEIELEDDEEFDIKKLQLVKSDYEFDQYPYWIIADYIMYDGRQIYECGGIDYIEIEGRFCNEFVVEELY